MKVLFLCGIVVLGTRTRTSAFAPSPGACWSTTSRALPSSAQMVPPSVRLAAASDADNNDNQGSMDLNQLKAELLQYLETRKQVGADDLAQKQVGKTIGGTKGNVVLEYISGSPNKEFQVEAAANVLDYDELVKYGYSHLVAPIMQAGGRLAMYELLGMKAPDTSTSLKAPTAQPLVIDREGNNDKARYSGLKLGQAMDDAAQAEALQRAQTRAAQGESLRPKLMEESYELPFADQRNTSPNPTPEWTAEKLDEWGKQQGRVEAWARRAREEALVSDRLESFDLDLAQRVFSLLCGLMVATAFGKATPTFLDQILSASSDTRMAAQGVLEVLQGPAAGLLLASLGSSVLCALQAKEKNRNAIMWTVKGLLGGPFTVRSLQECSPLRTQAEEDEQQQRSKIGANNAMDP